MSAVLLPRLRMVRMNLIDLPTVAAIERSLYEFPWTHGNFADSIDSNYSCWVYRYDRDIIGYAILMLAVNEAHLLNISIDSGFQRRGLGRALLQRLVHVAREFRAERLILEVRPSNIAGLALYAFHGFSQIGRRRNYYPAANGREDALVLGLDL